MKFDILKAISAQQKIYIVAKPFRNLKSECLLMEDTLRYTYTDIQIYTQRYTYTDTDTLRIHSDGHFPVFRAWGQLRSN